MFPFARGEGRKKGNNSTAKIRQTFDGLARGQSPRLGVRSRCSRGRLRALPCEARGRRGITGRACCDATIRALSYGA